ncbi:hypothetical protein GCM10020219_049840 [Nonomuraea dietziae]
MKLAVVGGGGFRVPLVYGALLRDTAKPRVEEVVLHDVSAERLAAIRNVLDQLAEGHDRAPEVRTTTDLDVALRDADFVFSAVRVGGLAGRTPTSGWRWSSACSARRPPGQAASPSACAPSPWPCAWPSGWPPSRRGPGSSTSPTRPA